ncbi:MAG: hypothetical protein AB7P00_13430 [Sandaracinaceae bacterium]
MLARAGGLVERAVCEAIDAYAAPKVRAAVVELALRWARVSVIPERGPEVREFVEGALVHAAVQMLGAEAGDAIKAEMAPIVSMVAEREISTVRPSTTPPRGQPIIKPESDYPEIEIGHSEPPVRTARGQRAASPTVPGPISFARVLVASMDPASVAELSRWLAGAATVEPVRDALEVLDNLGYGSCGLVIVDCRRPAVSVETLLALAPDMPKDARVVLWGERHDLEQHLARLGVRMPGEWVCCGPAASAEDVGAIVRILLD